MTIQREVRPYKAGDEHVIVEVFNSAFGSNTAFFPRTEESWLWRYVNRPGFDSESVLIAEEGGKAVSTLVMTYANLMISGIQRKFALIDDIATLPEYQRKGHATSLVKRAIEIAGEKGCHAIHLTAGANASAMRIYEKLGFITIANLNFMESPLRIYNFAKAVGIRYLIPLQLLNTWMRFKEHRKYDVKIDIDVVTELELQKAFLTNQESCLTHNGLLVMDENYVAWMTEQRPVGKMIGLTATENEEIVGMVSISAHRMKTRYGTFQVGNIANLLMSDRFRTEEVLCNLLQTARLVAKDELGCELASIIVDSKDKVLNKACSYSKFARLGKGVAMVHPLANIERILEIKNSLWSQPLETVVADP